MSFAAGIPDIDALLETVMIVEHSPESMTPAFGRISNSPLNAKAGGERIAWDDKKTTMAAKDSRIVPGITLLSRLLNWIAQ